MRIGLDSACSGYDPVNTAMNPRIAYNLESVLINGMNVTVLTWTQLRVASSLL
jgi:hypothetical protein